jgi:5-methylcytosine-specific restriction enzyme subunit McrC
MAIPIENIYYLLSYSWNMLDEKNRVRVSTDCLTNLIDLLAKVLINSTRILLKRGIEQSYVEYETEVVGIKGKLAVSETLKANTLDMQRTICRFDEFSPDVLLNQILVSTLKQLMFVKALDRGLKEEIRYLLWMFPEIKQIEITKSHFLRLRLNRNNRFYGFVINVCELIHENLLPSEKEGGRYFTDFTRDEVKMYRLFENFVFNFYKIELKGLYKVRRESISWQFSYEDLSHSNFIPGMMTDITLENDNKKIIIDTKYYQETLAERFERKKIKSANLYQLFSYLLNQEENTAKNKNASGILLYPKIEEDYNLSYKYNTHPIFIKTINLNMRWDMIDKRLKEIVNT